MKRLAAVVAVIGLLAAPALAPAKGDDAQKLALTQKLVRLAQPSLDVAYRQLAQAVKMKCTKPGTVEQVRKVFDRLIAKITEVMAGMLSVEHLKAMLDFYSTPVGAKLVRMQTVILSEMQRAIVKMHNARQQGQSMASIAEAIPETDLDPARLAVARAMTKAARFGELMSRSGSGDQLGKLGITTGMMEEFWSRLMAKHFNLSEMNSLKVFYNSQAYHAYVEVTPRMAAETQRFTPEFQKQLVAIFQTCR